MSVLVGLAPELRALWRAQRRLALITLLLVCMPTAYLSWLAADSSIEGVGALLIVAYVMVPLLVTSGVVSGDVHTGQALLWLQKPVRPEAFYLERAGVRLLASLVLATAATGACAAVVLAGQGHDEARRILSLLPLGGLTALATAAVTFGVSGLGTTMDAPLALLYVLLSSAAGTLHTLLPEGLGRVARLGGFPLERLIEVEGWVRGRVQTPTTALLHLGGFCLAWVIVGLATTWITTRRPFPRG